MKRLIVLLLAVLLMPIYLHASDKDSFSETIKTPYLIWKQAIVITSRNNRVESERLVLNFISEWDSAVGKIRTVPSDYAKSKDFFESINEIKKNAEKALDEIRKDKVLESHETLEKIRYILWGLRAENGIISLNDKINDFHEIMEIVFEELELAETPEKVKKVVSRQGVWLKLKWKEVSALVGNNSNRYDSKFVNSVEEVGKSIDKLFVASEKKDVDKAEEAAKSIKKTFKDVFASGYIF